jgi:hypothetical protein
LKKYKGSELKTLMLFKRTKKLKFKKSNLTFHQMRMLKRRRKKFSVKIVESTFFTKETT